MEHTTVNSDYYYTVNIVRFRFTLPILFAVAGAYCVVHRCVELHIYYYRAAVA